jgi:hypothetical protein
MTGLGAHAEQKLLDLLLPPGGPPPPKPSMFEVPAIYWVEMRMPGDGKGEEVALNGTPVTPRVPAMFLPAWSEGGSPILQNGHMVVLPWLDPKFRLPKRRLRLLIFDQQGTCLFHGRLGPHGEIPPDRHVTAGSLWLPPAAMRLSLQD